MHVDFEFRLEEGGKSAGAVRGRVEIGDSFVAVRNERGDVVHLTTVSDVQATMRTSAEVPVTTEAPAAETPAETPAPEAPAAPPAEEPAAPSES